ncbi:MAG: hypothetical protein DDT19_01521 [Syntrophomonadaceae bacterium]|nr:hypothetical protein [Bacillota bacterium]
MALAAGDIAGAGHEVMWVFNATADRVILLNPRAVAGAAGASLTADNRFTGNQTFQGRVNTATSVAGTADAITATYSPPFTAWVDRMHGRFRATAANTTTAPTFAPDGLIAKTIVKENLVALAVGDIAGAGHEVEWIFNATADRVVLLNPRVVGGLGGRGTINRVARFTAATTLGDSVISDDGANVNMNARLRVVGTAVVGVAGTAHGSPTGLLLSAPAGAAGNASTGIHFGGDGIAHANIAWMPNERNFVLRTGNASTDLTDFYGGANLSLNGRLGIRIASPTASLHALGADSLNTSFAGNISGATGTGLIITNANNVSIGMTTPAHQFQLSTDSAGKPGTNTWTIVSDKRLKKSIELANLDLCYNAVKNIPLSFYRWRDDVYSVEQVRDRGMLGWIADDVEKVYPKAVKTVPFELLTKEKIEDCKSVNNDQVYAALYGAVQKLIEKVEALERRIR